MRSDCRIAVLGLATMGGRIAGRLLEAGYELHVWNRTAAKADDLVRRGAKLASTPASAAARVDAVITVVADPAALRAVSEGCDGFVAGLGEETAVIQMSTVGLSATVALAESLGPTRPLLDAPVLGSIAEAEQGSLVIFVGGEPALVRRWTPLLETLGQLMHVGPVGSGSAAKLVANMALLTSVAALGEALALADALGLSRATAYEVLAPTPSGVQAKKRRESIESQSYSPRYKLALALKDALLIADAADTTGADLRLAGAVRTWLIDSDLAGLRESDYTAMIAQILDANALQTNVPR